ncbi:MAG: LptF/LptG family permease [Bacteroidales bacterium]|nr:LptF/LptG family permease [Bacteroidales bacterium]
MKKLDRLILRSFLGPLVLTFTISVFVLLMQFLWKYIDDMVGKGLEFGVIAELLLYASATFVPMALPIAVLFASIMTMGNFGEKYELVAMKAGGISIRRVMMPMALVVLLLTGVAFVFANNVMPSAMLHYRMTLYDITRKKPAVNIRPGEYYKEIEGYVIRVGAKAPDGCTLEDIVIYDHSHGTAENNVIVARSGVMQTTLDNRYLLFTLTDGYSYSEPISGKNYRRRPLTTVRFDRQTIAFDISSFAYNRSGEDLFKGSYQMMNIAQLDAAVARLDSNLDDRFKEYRDGANTSFRAWALYCGRPIQKTKTAEIDLQPMDETSVAEVATQTVRDNVLPFRHRGDNNSEPTGKEVRKEVKARPETESVAEVEEVEEEVVEDAHATLEGLLSGLDSHTRTRVYNRARSMAATGVTDARNYSDMTRGDREYINRHKIEKQRKFTLSIACLLMFLIGAPFGSIVRKGGLGMPLVASVIFFVIYYVVGMIAEKAVRESVLGPEGMWVSSMVMLPIGIVLTLQATTDSAFFDSSSWKKFFQRTFHRKA